MKRNTWLWFVCCVLLMTSHLFPANGAEPVRVKDTTLRKMLDDPWTLRFSHESMPRAYQHSSGVHSSYYNISMDKHARGSEHEPSGNATTEFPWNHPGGVTNVSNIATQGMFWHPQKLPIAVYGSASRRVNGWQPTIQWTFPIDSRVGEVIAVKSGRDYTVCEIRLLIREADEWGFEFHRQWWYLQQLVDRAKELGFTEDAQKLAASERVRIEMTDNKHNLGSRRFRDVHHAHSIPKLSVELVAELRKEPLKLTYDKSELIDNHSQILPVGYRPGMIGEARDECMRCHDDVGKHVDYLDSIGRDWYGFQRGSDKIFSFHPFAKSAISTNGFDLPKTLNAKLLNSGHIVRYNAQTRPSKYYRRLP